MTREAPSQSEKEINLSFFLSSCLDVSPPWAFITNSSLLRSDLILADLVRLVYGMYLNAAMASSTLAGTASSNESSISIWQFIDILSPNFVANRTMHWLMINLQAAREHEPLVQSSTRTAWENRVPPPKCAQGQAAKSSSVQRGGSLTLSTRRREKSSEI